MARKETVKIKKQKKAEAHGKEDTNSSQKVGKDTLKRLRFAQQCLLYRSYYASLGKEEWWWIMDDVQELIAKQLNDQGYVVLDGLLTDKHAANLKAEVVACHEAGLLETAGLVNGKLPEVSKSTYVDTYTRGDLIGWFDPGDKAWTFGGHLDSYLVRLGTLISELGSDAEHPRLVPDLGRVTSRSKAMIACYPGGGARYVKHVDNDGKHPLCKTRLLTALMYLNESWQPGDGGELAVFSSDDDTELRDVVEPLSNRLLIFWSDWRTPHEVLAASKPRYAVTLWVLDNTCNGTQEGKEVIPKQATLQELAEGETGSKPISYNSKEAEALVEETSNNKDDANSALEDVDDVQNEQNRDREEGDKEDASIDLPLPVPFERGGTSYRWLSKEDDSWELLVDIFTGEEAPSCPVVDISEDLVQLSTPSSSSSSSPPSATAANSAKTAEPESQSSSNWDLEQSKDLEIFCRLPLPSLGKLGNSWLPGAPRWSRKRGRLTIAMTPAGDSLAASPRLSASERLAEQLSAHGHGFVDGFLGGPEADQLRELLFAARGEKPKTVSQALVPLEAEEGSEAQRHLDEFCEKARRLLEMSGMSSKSASSSVQLMGSIYVQGGRFPIQTLQPESTTSEQTTKSKSKLKMLLMCFLNPFWKAEDGGHVRLQKKAAQKEVSSLADEPIEPLHGRAVAFLEQDGFEHAVTTSLAVGAAVLVGVYQ
eukprot:CAMPEP_0206492494 /NCGR_PEP_ID=MMETSP0324_2-20121206/46146_1 /ASSEMBLY_ACC=CAM_ASM_000836 /TAXON_ID=2866 /ORGANISM="Crypthecodinium cohnii, Strain Seligo" /LENGTH=707 /DNA_ID=CAMNT_0053974929 /DNA_START=32 /DNA_END=2155 /DNA_ORIENTATION=+